MNHTRKYGLYLALLAISLLTAACGIKPKELSSPSDDEKQFPRTYPAPAADTK